MAQFVFKPNTTADIYRNGRAPPAAPDVAGVPCMLVPRFRNIKTNPVYTHIALFPLGTDIRDNPSDTFYVPNQNGTPFTVSVLTRIRSGNDVKKVLASRGTPPWPTNYL